MRKVKVAVHRGTTGIREKESHVQGKIYTITGYIV